MLGYSGIRMYLGIGRRFVPSLKTSGPHWEQLQEADEDSNLGPSLSLLRKSKICSLYRYNVDMCIYIHIYLCSSTYTCTCIHAKNMKLNLSRCNII